MKTQFIMYVVFNLGAVTIFFRGAHFSWLGISGSLLGLIALNCALHPWYRRHYAPKYHLQPISFAIMFINAFAFVVLFALNHTTGVSVVIGSIALGATMVYNHRALYGPLITF